MPDNIKEESDQGEEDAFGANKKRKRRKLNNGYIVEEITGRDIQMATAYGGVAKPRIRKVAARFTSNTKIDRTGLSTSHGPSRPGNPKI